MFRLVVHEKFYLYMLQPPAPGPASPPPGGKALHLCYSGVRLRLPWPACSTKVFEVFEVFEVWGGFEVFEVFEVFDVFEVFVVFEVFFWFLRFLCF